MRKTSLQFVRRLGVLLLGSVLPYAVAHAQWTAQDSLRLSEWLDGKEEFRINPDAQKMIQIDILPVRELRGKQEMDAGKPWMQFVSDLPTSFADTARTVRPKHIPLLPFSAFTRWNENPFARQDAMDENRKWKITWKLNRRRHLLEVNGHPIPAGMDPEIGPGRGGGAGVSVGFDANKMLYESFTKRGRAIRRNRKHAKAWKTYGDNPVAAPRDSFTVARPLKELPSPGKSDE